MKDGWLRAAIRTMLALGLLYASAVVLGLAIFAALFKLGVFGSVAILFFRGLVLAMLAAAALFASGAIVLARWRPLALGVRDAFAAAVLSLSVNTCFLVVVPVTVDRSVSVFILGEMAIDPTRTYAAEDVAALFTRVYVGDYAQVDRRLREQRATGNVEETGGRYRITARGRAFIAFARTVADLFGGDPRFASPPRR